ncbi:hypothetical protein ASF53_08205 [Methylobacterium sp. Leaf123]|uniref:hypothetical protein n=1 Tax=Methylobacterium sp. Leaf123 TaxID=1736264 RepID=UPI0006F8D657|nr:hypothetical protein [Methylobacterium sp. Leaf123]KQQ14608.1 hypothetical protein ASF53_08205 [Methylobacterium sp. Leaf123]
MAEAASQAGWQRIGAAVERVAAEAAIPVQTIAHAHGLVAHAAGRWPAPDAVQPGYWPTLCLTWPAIEIEIHDDRFELYRFGPGATQIREGRCGPDAPAAETLDALLHAAFGETP